VPNSVIHDGQFYANMR